MSSVPSCARALGTTIPEPKSRKAKCNAAKRWSATLNNYSDLEFNMLCAKISTFCRYAIVSKEVGASGTPHLQFYLEFKEKRRPIGVFDNNRIHFESAKGSKADNITYCTKEDKNPWYWPKPYTVDIQLYDWQIQITNIMKGLPDDRLIYWLYDHIGGIGKTTFLKWVFLNFPDVVVSGGCKADMMNSIAEFYEAKQVLPKIVLIDIPRSQLNRVSYAGIESVKSMFFHSTKYHGLQVCGASPHLLIFANEPPVREQLSADRWRIGQLGLEGRDIGWEGAEISDEPQDEI